MIGALLCVAPSIELVACPWVRFFPHPRSCCCCRRIYAFLSVSAAHSGRGGCNRRGGGLPLARLPGALNQARWTRRSTRLSTTVRNFKLMEAALPWISESEAAKSTAPHYAPVPSRTPRLCHAARHHAASTAAAASAEFNAAARYGRASP